MSKQKERLLALQRLLAENTDEDHRLNAPELLAQLQAQGLQGDRKSLYDDIESLRVAGQDIQLGRGRGGGYWLADRLFELPELKLLVDAVQAARFITPQKSAQLIKKLESLTSIPQARQLQRQVVVQGRAKAGNESIYYVVDDIHAAITDGCQLSFRYRAWQVDADAPGGFSAQDRHNGRRYYVSPWALVWMEENYYLIAFEEDSQAIRHYRVDKMHDQRLEERSRNGQQQFEQFDLASYTQSLFGMFGGQAQEVHLEMKDHLVGVLADRFGRSLTVCPASRPGWFSVWLRVVPGPAFYGWLMSFGPDAQLLAPADMRAALARYAAELGALYPPQGDGADNTAETAETP